jgi:hypothetical protein
MAIKLFVKGQVKYLVFYGKGEYIEKEIEEFRMSWQALAVIIL